MSSFQKFHGIRLAANGFIENLRAEQLATDPAPVAAGRSWYNTTEKALKFSSLDENSAVIVHTFATEADLAALASIVNTINGDSATEGSFRKAIQDVVGAAPEALDTLQKIAAALNNDANLHDTLTNLVQTSIDNLNSDILGTATEAMDTLGEVQAAINSINTVIGELSALQTTEKGSVVGAINEVKAQANTADQARGDLNTLETTEKSSIVGAINELKTGAGAGAEALKNTLNSRVHSFDSETPVTTLTVTHNFGTKDISLGQIQVYDATDSEWRNDVIPATFAPDGNSFTLNLVEASRVCGVVQNLSPIA